MEMEDILQHIFGFLRCRLFQVHPKEKSSVGKKRRHQEHFDMARIQPALRGKGKRANHASSRPAPGCLSLLCTQNKTRLFDNKGDKTRQRARSGRGTQTSV